MIFFGGGVPYPIFFGTNLLVRVKLVNLPNFNFLGKSLLVEKYVHGKKERRRSVRSCKIWVWVIVIIVIIVTGGK